jgi:peptide/nickel transport system permease protein
VTDFISTSDEGSPLAGELTQAALGPVALASERDGHPRRRWRVGVVLATAWLVVVILAAITAKILPIPSPYAINALDPRAAPSLSNLFGTDDLGRSELSRAIYGARVSLSVGALVTVISAVIGGGLGVVAGYFRGWTENLIMSACDILIAFPALILAFALTAVLGGTFQNVVIVITLIAIPVVARVTRSQTLSLRNREFVRASEALGARTRRILVLEIAPNVLPTVVTYGIIVFAFAIVIEGALDFLGLGIPPPTPTWGGMIAAGQVDIVTSPYQSLIPAAVMFVTILSLNVVAERLSAWFASRTGGG